MNFNNIDLQKIPDIALGKVAPSSMMIQQMKEEMENERYEKLEGLLKQIQETSKEQIKCAKSEAESAKKDTNRANRIAVISSVVAIISLLMNVAMFIVSLISAGLI